MPNFLDAKALVLYAGYLLVGVAAYLIMRMIMQEQETLAAQESLEESRDRKASSKLVQWTRPFFSQYVVPLIRGKPFWDQTRKKFRRKIISAGLKAELTPDEFIAFKFFLVLLFPIIAALLKVSGTFDLEWYYILGSSVVGWFYPNFWVKKRIEVRQKQVLKSLPFVVDLLALSTEAGLDFIGAIGKVVEKAASSPLIEELEQVLKEIKIGASRAEALREMAVRLNMREIGSFMAVLISADQMGASIGKILRQQSEQIRSERFLRAEKLGAAAASKLMLPIVLLILPAVFLMVAGPFVLSFIYGGG